MILLALYPLIGQTIPPGPFSYPGQEAHTREEIIVDPQNCPVLDNAYKELVGCIGGEILETLFHFVRENLFDLTHCRSQEVEEFIRAQPSSAIPLDLFLQEKKGVCRHIALTTTYLLNRLVKDGYLQGEVFFIRENLSLSRHAWTLFVTQEAIWHLDPYWNVLENAQIPESFEKLCRIYGRAVIEQPRCHH